MFKTILVAVDGSGHAKNAVRYAADLAKTYGAALVLLAVGGQRPLAAPLAELAQSEDLSRSEIFRRILSSALALAEVSSDLEVERLVCDGDPGDETLAQAERLGADLIVIGSRGLGAYAELLLGSVSRKVLHLAKVPVMVVRG